MPTTVVIKVKDEHPDILPYGHCGAPKDLANKVNHHDDTSYAYKNYITGRWFTGEAYSVGMEHVRNMVGGQNK